MSSSQFAKNKKSIKEVQKQIQLSFTGYEKSNIKTALEKIRKESLAFNVTVHGTSVKRQIKLVQGQPKLWGCDKEDVTIRTLLVSGYLKDIKNLVRLDTPDGVQIELLSPQV